LPASVCQSLADGIKPAIEGLAYLLERRQQSFAEEIKYNPHPPPSSLLPVVSR